MTETPNLGLPVIVAQQAMKHVTHYEALIRLDALVFLTVISMNQMAPPAAPAAGDRYLVGANSSDAFASYTGAVASFDGSSWRFMTPHAGWILFNQADSRFYFFDGSVWAHLIDQITPLQNLSGLGIGTSSDATNKMAVKANSVLLTALGHSEGGAGDLRVTLNKETSDRTVSQIYQSNWSGRAETGLMGDDQWRLKVSPDGSNWFEAITALPATGAVRIDRLLSGRSLSTYAGRFECEFDGRTGSGIVLSDQSNSDTALALGVWKGGTRVGAIQVSATGTIYSTASDYRLKRDVAAIGDAPQRLMQLRPCRFAFHQTPDERVDGFLAHEVADVVPEAVSGKKDACDDTGQILPQSLDLARLVPLLTAALQDVVKRLDRLEARG